MLSSAGAAVMYPTFQPVMEKVFPAEAMRIQRSRMPGSVIKGI